MKSRIMYIERKAEELTGEARIGRVTFSKTGRTIFYQGRSFQSVAGSAVKCDYVELETGASYWIASCHKEGADRSEEERVPVEIDEDAAEEYWAKIRATPRSRREEAKRVKALAK